MERLRLLVASELDLTRRDGSTTHLEMLVRQFVAKGHEVVSVFPRFPGRPEVGLPGEVVRIPLSVSPAGKASRGVALLEYQRRMRRAVPALARNHRFDAAYVREGIATFGLVDGAKAARLPLAVEVNGLISEELAATGLPSFSGRLRDILAGPALRRADRIVTVSEGISRRLALRYGIPLRRMTAIPNGVDPDQFRPGDAPAAKARLSIAADEPVAAWTGYMAPWQDLGLMLDAWSKATEGRRGTLLIVGGGPGEEALKARAAEADLAGKVRFLGRVPHAEIPSLLSAADVAIAPFERGRPCSPLKVFEYLACGRPVVATDLPDLRFVEETGSGRLVSGGAADFADALRDVLSDPEAAARMGANARRTVLERYTWSATADKVLAVIGGIARGRKGAQASSRGGGP